MKKKFKIIIIFVLVVFVGLLAGKILFPKPVVNSTPTPTINITYNNLASVYSKGGMVNSVPKDSVIMLHFYNFNTGKRVIEKSFVIKKGNVKEGNESSDVTIYIHSKYLKSMTNKNLCAIIKKADKNGDLGMDTSLSKTALAWKFKGMFKYRECLS